ncbi:MAG: DUF2520 domain-containing protein [Candidatus Acidiferrum sp.]
MKKSLAIVGAGRVGRALGRRLREGGWKIGAVITRSETSARKAVRFIGAGRPRAEITPDVALSNVILMSMPDDSLTNASKTLAAICGGALRRKIVLHTSGTRNANVLDAVKRCGAAVGSMHPMQSFSGAKVPSLKAILFAIEGDAAAMRLAKEMVKSLGGTPAPIAAAKKALYHAAGVMAAGHALALLEAATRMLMASGIKRREAVRALLPLTRQVLDNFERLDSSVAWTGPLARGDYGVVREHRKALRGLPEEIGEAYEALNHLAARMLAKNPEAMLLKLRAREEKNKVGQSPRRNEAQVSALAGFQKRKGGKK